MIISGLAGTAGSAWTFWQFRQLKCLKGIFGMIILSLAFIDSINGLFFMLDGITNFFDYENDVIFFVTGQFWDWMGISSSIFCLEMAGIALYIVVWGGNTATIAKIKYYLIFSAFFIPIPLFFGVYAIASGVPIYLAGRYHPDCLTQFCKSVPAEVYFVSIMIITHNANILTSVIAWSAISGKKIRCLSWLTTTKFTNSTPKFMMMRLLFSYSCATVITWSPFVLHRILVYLTNDRLNERTTFAIHLIRVLTSPSRGLFHAIAFYYTTQLVPRTHRKKSTTFEDLESDIASTVKSSVFEPEIPVQAHIELKEHTLKSIQWNLSEVHNPSGRISGS